MPAWHDGYREMPFVFVGSAGTAAGGLGLLAAPAGQAASARGMALFGVATELGSTQLMERRLGMVAEPYSSGRYLRTGKALSAAGLAGALLGRGNRVVNALSGAALLAGSGWHQVGVFHAGRASSDDPKCAIVPQRERLRRGQPVRSGDG